VTSGLRRDRLKPLPGGRGEVIFYSPEDYPVERDRQIAHGATNDLAGK
jgi:hypothetical protein